MEENLVIVESPAKAKTIEKFLGKEFSVKSSYGHIRDLSKKKLGIETDNQFMPLYEIPDDKNKLVNELKSAAKKAKMVWLASDEDREGEAIAWHLSEVLELKNEKTKRIVFHEITKNAILEAVKNPRSIDMNLVNAQQARRVLDRLVGFELSPILWKKIRPALSAGRVQSVAVRLIVEREREIINFKTNTYYKVSAVFEVLHQKGGKSELKADLSERFSTKKQANDFLLKCKTAGFKISDITTKPAKRSPAPPFTTSTLQQEASRKLNFSVAQTMSVAQKLYEGGKITYMRTDSLNLSDLAIGTIKKEILKEYGEKYLHIKKYKTKIKGAQEAHEAIRPTYIDNHEISGTAAEKKLYDLIWKRTIASQMTDAAFEKTTVTIDISNANEKFLAQGEVLIFDGFLKIYSESTDDEKDESADGLLPPLKTTDKLSAMNIAAIERYEQHLPRYTEASLVKKLEELSIGRPSTYAPIISTIQQRGYVVKEDRAGNNRNYFVLYLENNKITETEKSEFFGVEKSKLFPTDIGMVVNDFLVEHFGDILEYSFTATVEKEFDEIALGKLEWSKMITKFYKPFHKTVVHTMEHTERNTGQKLLGNDPVSNKPVYVKIGKYGPLVQMGETDNTDKPRFASLLKDQHLETITLEEALDLFKLPREVGMYENKKVVAAVGKFGPYVSHNSKFYSLKKEDNPLTVTLPRSIELIKEKIEKDKNKIIRQFDDDLSVLNGRWGAYICYKKDNYKIPKKLSPTELSKEECMKIIKEQGTKEKKGGKEPKEKTKKSKK
ncbi:MAG: DNA topoisomerase I [Bacteroidetes bacterium RIFOXYA12_FULL_35_11]|nr:MAG: DNA topoisomerase I [Bacteroidetes bacterium GWF2_35_48]OFY72348.1 MAG: DNA topoisomerase I [Bacteroidetes bacterium RIFOXYA12_FULL_35_11]OFY93814.1 MAG: DNA topoisomerase I [Bacteroidetes bacterium RIFOXYC12_FULL_35_7]HBX50181.1 type I DNA topoisomerase [Bacteroidales bacterium]